jgi:hypothetical protein
MLTIKNRSTVAIKRDTECVTNLEPGQDVYADVYAYVLSADRTDCPFSNVRSAR